MAIYKGNKCVAGVGRTPTIAIRPSDNHWIIDGVGILNLEYIKSNPVKYLDYSTKKETID